MNVCGTLMAFVGYVYSANSAELVDVNSNNGNIEAPVELVRNYVQLSNDAPMHIGIAISMPLNDDGLKHLAS